MFLAFQLSDIITVPFGWLLSVLYETTHNYGVAMILFAVIVQLILLPLNAKSKKSMMKMSRLTPKMQAIQQKYADDPQRQNQAIQELQKSEGVSMGGGCLWSFIPILILFPLFAVIRQPITYILMQSADTAKQIVEVIKTAAPDMFTSNAAYEQVVAAQLIPQYASELRAAIPGISEVVLAGINFDFLGINLGAVPQFNVFSASWVWDWAHIGAFLIALTSAACQLLQMVISQKTNDSVITDEKGVQDKETAKNSQQNQSMKVMMWMMPLMSLWIGFTVSAGLSLYWFIGGVVRMISDPIMTSHYRKIYDAEDAVRRFADLGYVYPGGITANTSKKKLEKQQRDQEQAAKAAAAKEYAARKGIVEEAAKEENAPLSGVSDRPFCKGRNYDPDRYAPKSMEE